MSKKTLLKQVLFGRTQRYIWLCLFLLAFSFLSTFFNEPKKAEAAASSTMNFQARLLQSSGALVPDGYYNAQFKLYDVSTSGTALWTETYYDSNGPTVGNDNRVRVVNGYLTVNLGSQTAFPGNINWDQELWLTMNIGGTTQTDTPSWDGEMSPRLKLTAVPHAFTAAKLQQTDGGNTSTLGFATQTGSHSILLPDEGGTICLQGSGNCGFVSGSSTNFIQNSTSPQSADFNITGNGTVGGTLATSTIDRASSGTLSIGTTTATAVTIGRAAGTVNVAGGNINLQGNTAVSSGNTLSVVSGELAVTGRSSGSNTTLRVNNHTSTGSIFVAQKAAVDVFIIDSNGAVTSKIDSTTAFQIQNADANNNLFIADTTNTRIGIGATPANSLLTIGTNTTTAAGGITFGTDTNLYRSGSNTLKTDDNLLVQTSSNSATAFQVQNSSAANLFQVDTLNNNIVLGGNNSGELQSWSTATNALPETLYAATSVTANGYIYTIGGYNGSAASAKTYYAKLNANGSVGSWTEDTSSALPEARYYASSVVTNGYVYVFGGNNGTSSQTTTYYAKLNSDGTLGTWIEDASSPLPAARYGATSVAANGYVYVMGGAPTTSNPQTTIYYAKVNADGSLGSWATEATNPLSSAVYYAASAYANGYVYIIGGATSSPTALDSVYYAKLNANGSVGSWTEDTSSDLPSSRKNATSIVANGYIYVIGGQVTTTPTTGTYYARLNADGSLGTWTTASSLLPASRVGHTSVMANGYVYAIGGASASSSGWASTVYYASTQRIQVGGSLDLVGLAGYNLADPGSMGSGNLGGSLTAGDTNLVGYLQVQGQALFAQGLAVNGAFTANNSALFQNSTDSTTAFQIQNADANNNLFIADTTNTRIGIGATPANSLLTIGTNTTTAAGGITFGTDTNLYRHGFNVLKTDSTFMAANNIYSEGKVTAADDTSGQVEIGALGPSGEAAVLFGFGSGADTNLYRSAANTLKTDDTFDANAYSVGGTAGASTTCSAGEVLQGQVVVGGIVTGGTCGAGGALSLQAAYDGGNSILTTDGNDIDITLANTSTDANFIVDIASGSTGEFKIQNSGSDILQIGSTGQLQLDATGSNGGLLIGGDTQLYRSAADTISLGVDDDLAIQGSAGDSLRLAVDNNAAFIAVSNNSASDWLLVSSGPSEYRYKLYSDGYMEWGDGTNSPDTTLYRSEANTLATDGSFDLGGHLDANVLYSRSGFELQGPGTADEDAVRLFENSDSLFLQHGDGGSIIFRNETADYLATIDGDGLSVYEGGIALNSNIDGSASTGLTFGYDTNLYRSAANTLKTDDSLSIGDNLNVSGTVSLATDQDNAWVNLGAAGAGDILNLYTSGDTLVGAVSSTGQTLFKNSSNSATAFQVQRSNGDNILTADTANSRVLIGSAASPTLSSAQLAVTVLEVQTRLRVGNATNGFSFNDTATGESGKLRLYGSARNIKKLVFVPEYSGAVLSQTPSACSGSDTGNGSMTAGLDGSAMKNYYKWTSSQTSCQSYEIVLQIVLPEDWDGWAESAGDYSYHQARVSSTFSAGIGLTILDTTGSVDLDDADVTPGSANTWVTEGGTLEGTYTAGGVMTMIYRLEARNGASAQLGNISFEYLSKF